MAILLDSISRAVSAPTTTSIPGGDDGLRINAQDIIHHGKNTASAATAAAAATPRTTQYPLSLLSSAAAAAAAAAESSRQKAYYTTTAAEGTSAAAAAAAATIGRLTNVVGVASSAIGGHRVFASTRDLLIHHHHSYHPSPPPSSTSIVNSNTIIPTTTKPPLKKAVKLSDLPIELWTHIFQYLPTLSPLSSLNHQSHAILQSRYFRRLYLYARHGVPLSLYHAYRSSTHRFILDNDPDMVEWMVQGGAKIPRFWAQILSSNRRGHSLVEQKILDIARRTYDGDSRVCLFHSDPVSHPQDPSHWIKADDVYAFETLSNDLDSNLPQLRTLITAHAFIPLSHLTPTSTFRLFQLLVADMSLLDTLINNGLDPVSINEPLLAQLFSAAHSSELTRTLLPKLLARGFTLSKPVILSLLHADHPSVPLLSSLTSLIPPSLLASTTLQLLSSQFGPSCTHFSPSRVSTLCDAFTVSEHDIRTSLLQPSNVYCLPYLTRCFEQANPVAAWTWVVNRYPPTHPFSTSCFDDLIVWLGELGPRYRRLFPTSSTSLPWSLILEFMDRGCHLSPRNLIHLAKLRSYEPTVPVLALDRLLTTLSRTSLTPSESREWTTALTQVISLISAIDEPPVQSSRNYSFLKLRPRRSSSSSSSSLGPIQQPPSSFLGVLGQVLRVVKSQSGQEEVITEKKWKFKKWFGGGMMGGFGGLGFGERRARTWS
ncbi:hypothetical protein DFS34DRAFT_119609 [Phlyctochytrium arcticum]|nr:hypothetical protein DFS34DRAFT_119609 [Phlyctochytrium arcticum]